MTPGTLASEPPSDVYQNAEFWIFHTIESKSPGSVDLGVHISKNCF